MGQSRHADGNYLISISRPLSELKHSMSASSQPPPPPVPPRAPPRKPPQQQQQQLPRHGDALSPVFAPDAARPVVAGSSAASSGLCVQEVPAEGPGEDLVIVERCFNLAKLMLSPEGLAVKKVTLEGFAIPTALRLLHHQPPASALLALTWLEHDTVGLDVRGLTTVGRGISGGDDNAAKSIQKPAAAFGTGIGDGRHTLRIGGIGSGESGGGGSRCFCSREDALIVVLAWSCGAEVVLEAASRDQRDLLARCVELMMSDMLRLEGPLQQEDEEEHDAALDEIDLNDNNDNRYDDVDDCALDEAADQHCPLSLPAKDDEWRENSRKPPPVPIPRSKNNAATTPANRTHPEALLHITSKSLSPPPPPRRASHRSPFPSSVLPPSSGRPTTRKSFERPLVRGFSAPDAVWRRQRGGSTSGSTSRNMTRSGASLSPTPGDGRRSRVSGGWGGGGVGAGPAGGRMDAEAAAELRQRAEEVMVRILLVYDRAKDESRAAAWRVGVSGIRR